MPPVSLEPRTPEEAVNRYLEATRSLRDYRLGTPEEPVIRAPQSEFTEADLPNILKVLGGLNLALFALGGGAGGAPRGAPAGARRGRGGKPAQPPREVSQPEVERFVSSIPPRIRSEVSDIPSAFNAAMEPYLRMVARKYKALPGTGTSVGMQDLTQAAREAFLKYTPRYFDPAQALVPPGQDRPTFLNWILPQIRRDVATFAQQSRPPVVPAEDFMKLSRSVRAAETEIRSVLGRSKAQGWQMETVPASVIAKYLERKGIKAPRATMENPDRVITQEMIDHVRGGLDRPRAVTLERESRTDPLRERAGEVEPVEARLEVATSGKGRIPAEPALKAELGEQRRAEVGAEQARIDTAKRALASLDQRDRDLLEALARGKTLKQVAEDIGVHTSRVGVLAKRAQDRFNEALEQFTREAPFQGLFREGEAPPEPQSLGAAALKKWRPGESGRRTEHWTLKKAFDILGQPLTASREEQRAKGTLGPTRPFELARSRQPMAERVPGGPEYIYETAKELYRNRAREVHPDRPGGSTEAFQQLKEAFDFIERQYGPQKPTKAPGGASKQAVERYLGEEVPGMKGKKPRSVGAAAFQDPLDYVSRAVADYARFVTRGDPRPGREPDPSTIRQLKAAEVQQPQPRIGDWLDPGMVPVIESLRGARYDRYEYPSRISPSEAGVKMGGARLSGEPVWEDAALPWLMIKGEKWGP